MTSQSRILQIQHATLVGCLLVSGIGLTVMAFLRGVNVYDESVFLTIARGILQGKQPYLDLWDTKPPGLYYLAASWINLAGTEWWVPRIAFALTLLQIAIFLILARKHFSWHAVLFGAGVLALGFLAKGGYRVDTHMMAGTLIAVAATLIYGPYFAVQPRAYIFALLTGVATTVNQIGVLYFLGFLSASALNELTVRSSPSARSLFRHYSIVLLCYILPIVGMGMFVTLAGIFPAYWDATILQPRRLAEEIVSVTWHTSLFISQLLQSPTHLVFLGIGGLWLATQSVELIHNPALVRNSYRRWLYHPNTLFIALAAFGIATTIIRYVNQHWLSSAFFFSFLTAAMLDSLAASWSGFLRRLLRPLATIGLLAMSMVIWWSGPIRFLREDRLTIDMQQGREIYRELSTCIAEDAPILVISPISPRLYYLVQHFPPWPWIYIDDSNYGLVSWHEDVVNLVEGATVQAILLEQPRGVDRITERGPTAQADEFTLFSEFRTLLEKYYRLLPLATSYHPIHNTDTELHMLTSLDCGRQPQNNPLFPESFPGR